MSADKLITPSEEQLVTLRRLLSITERLHLETVGFLNNGDNQQLWYNRGYANGIVEQLTRLGYRTFVEDNIVPDPDNIIEGHEFWAWGKAYRHGMAMGMKETLGIIGPAQSYD